MTVTIPLNGIDKVSFPAFFYMSTAKAFITNQRATTFKWKWRSRLSKTSHIPSYIVYKKIESIIVWIFFTGDCSPGHWCLSGVDRPYPGLNNQSTPFNVSCYDDRMVGTGGVCPVGHYCPGGIASYLPVPCDNGTYSDVEGLDACKTCPPGKPINVNSYFFTKFF